VSLEEKDVRADAQARRTLIEDRESWVTPTAVVGEKVLVGIVRMSMRPRFAPPSRTHNRRNGMGKVGKALLVVFLGAALAWAASEPWNSKPYRSWDREDVIKVLNRSPWSKTISVSARWKSAGPELEMPTPGNPAGGRGEGPTMGGGHPQQGGGYGGQGGPELEPTMTPQAWFQARWLSSRVMREALARSAVLNGAATEAQAEQYVARRPASYEIGLVGSDMTPFEKLDEGMLKQSAYLEVKKTHERVPASSVSIQRGKDGKISAVVYSFPKTLANGEPVITPKEKEAKFVCGAGKNLTMKFDFDLGKMVDQQGRDL
jgi:hypothetical protein